MNHKKVLSWLLSISMMLALSLPAFASSNTNAGQTITFNENKYTGLTAEEAGIEKLRACGHSNKFIETIPTTTLEAIGSSCKAQQSISYHKEAITTDGTIDLVKISQTEYEAIIDAEMQARTEALARQIAVIDEDGNPIYVPDNMTKPANVTESVDGGTLTVMTTMYQITDGLLSQYAITAEYVWATPPSYRGSDYFGVTRDTNTSMIPGSFSNYTFYREYRYYYLATNTGVQSVLHSTNDFDDENLPNQDSAATGFVIKIGMPVDVNPPSSMLVGSSFLSRNYANMCGGVSYQGVLKAPSVIPQSFNNYSTYWHQDATKLFGGFSLNIPFGASFTVSPSNKFSTPVEDVILATWDTAK